MNRVERPNSLNISTATTLPPETNDASRARNKNEDGIEQDSRYIQLKPMHKSYSEPNILTASPRDVAGIAETLFDKRSYSSPYILEGYTSRKSITEDMPVKKEYYALFCLGPKNPIRRVAIAITESKLFDYFILMTIMFSCIVMAIDAPLPANDKSSMNRVASEIEYYLLGIFGGEAVLRIIATGFILHPHSYLRSIWNVLDFVVVIFGIVTLDEITSSSLNLKALRAVRVLRPLKLISGIPSLQVVMMSIVRAVVPLLQVLFLVIFVIVIFAIIGLEFLYDKSHYSCWSNKTQSFDNLPCDFNVGLKTKYLYGRKCPTNTTCMPGWTGYNYGITSFDNIFLSIITVFQCVTMEGWTQIMYYTFYSTDIHGYLYSLYFIGLIVIGSFFMLNLVLGVLSGEFAKEREKVENRRAFLKIRQNNLIDNACEKYLNWIAKGDDLTIMEEDTYVKSSIGSDVIKNSANSVRNDTNNTNPALVFQTHPNSQLEMRHRKNKFKRLQIFIKKLRVKLKGVVKHQHFFWLVISMVFINTCIMATKHYEQPDWLTDIQRNAEYVFVSVFTFEMLLKLFAHGVFGYCRSLFNVFDLVVVVLSIIELILRRINEQFSFGLSVLRCLRLLRVFKVTKYWKSLKNLVTSLMNAMNAIMSLIFLLFLFIFIWALLGMQLFGGKFVMLETLPRANFDTFKEALMTVFQVITGEDWNAVMYDGMRVYGATDAPGILVAFTYFFTLVIFGNYTLLNVFLAIAVDNLTNAEILTHDEEAAENKRLKANLQQAFEYDQNLGLNALSFVNNLQASVDSGERLSLRDGGKITNTNTNAIDSNGSSLHFNKNDSHDNSSSSSSDNASLSDSPRMDSLGISSSGQFANGSLDGSLTSPNKTPVVIQNGNPMTPEQLMRKRKSQGMFDQVLLQVPGTQKAIQCFSPTNKRPREAKYMENVQKKWKSIVEISNKQPDKFLNGNGLENGRRSSTSSSNFDGKQPRDMGTTFNGYDEYDDDDDEDDDVEERIKQKGMLNVLKFNVTNRRRIMKKAPIVQQSSLFIFTPSNRFRKVCHNIVHFRYFDSLIMMVILMSSVTLAIEDPVYDDAPRNKILKYFDYFFTTIFGLEVILKVIDKGLVMHKRAYLRNFWNCLDAFVFVCNLSSIILSLTATGSNQSLATQIIRVLRVLRVLRPLKAIQRVKKLKAVFQCMIYSLKNVTFVLIITFLILFIFACIGVQLFQGKFYYCTDPSKITKEECQGSYYKFESATSVADNDPEVEDRIWKRQNFHFDNTLHAFVTLFTSSTGEGWPSSMHNTIDATNIGQGPKTKNNPGMALYYFVFVVLFTFMIINIYIALIILTFQRQGEKEIEGGLDRNQRDCLQFVLNSKPRQRHMPKDKKSISYRVWYVVDSQPFDLFIMFLIVLNTLQLMMRYNNMSQSYTSMLTALNLSFTILFCIEAALKLVAYRLNYFKDLWNLFDLFVILGSCADLLIYFLPSEDLPSIDTSMFRLCRAGRIIKLLRKGESIRIMLWTFVQSFKALPYVTFMLLLLFYIYAIIGMQMFGKIKLGELMNGAEIHEYNNFRSLIQAVQVLFRSSTGEGWNSLMYECYSHALCDPAIASFPGEKCGNTAFAMIYFITFIFFCMFLLLNLFVAVIMDNFEYLTRDASILGPHHLQEFIRCWSEYDPQATGTIHHEQVFKVLCQLSPPVGFGKQCPKEIAYKRLIRMNMPVNKDGVSVAFYTTLLALIRTSLEIFVSGNMFDNDRELRRVMESIWPKDCQKNLPKLLPKMKGNGKQLTVGKIYCVKLIILKYRRSKGKNTTLTKKQVASPSVLTRINSLLPSLRRHLSHRSSINYNHTEDSRKSRDQLDNSHQNVRKIKSFGGRIRSQNEHHTRDGQLRRRSSWSDLPSFFKFNSKENSASTSNINTSGKEESNSNGQAGSAKTPTSAASTPTSVGAGGAGVANNNKNGRLSPGYGRQQSKNNKTTFTRTGSLRTNSNGNVVNHSQQRKPANKGGGGGMNNHNQYDSMNNKGGSSTRYQPNKSNKHYHSFSNSAPTTPRGSHSSGLSPSMRQTFDHRLSAQGGSPLPRRPSPQSSSSQHNGQHRRGQSQPDQVLSRDPQYMNNFRVSNYDPRNDISYQQQQQQQQGMDPNMSRSRSTSDPRKNIGIPSQRKEHSPPDNIDSYYHNNHAPPQSYDPRDPRGDPYREQNMGRSAKYLQESRSVPPKTNDMRGYPTHASQFDSRHLGAGGGGDGRVGVYPPSSSTKSNAEVGFHPIENNYQQQQQQQQRDAHYAQQQQYQTPGNDMEVRSSTTDLRRQHPQLMTSSTSPQKPQQHITNSMGSSYNDNNSNGSGRSDYVISGSAGGGHHLVTDNNNVVKSRDTYNKQGNPLENAKRGAVSPRHPSGQGHPSIGGQYSPNAYFQSTDNDLINGTPSKHYYDNMISQINDQIARVSDGGGTVAAQPFNTRAQQQQQTAANAIDDDDNEWC